MDSLAARIEAFRSRGLSEAEATALAGYGIGIPPADLGLGWTRRELAALLFLRHAHGHEEIPEVSPRFLVRLNGLCTLPVHVSLPRHPAGHR